MPTALKVTLSADLAQALSGLKPAAMVRAIERGMNKAGPQIVARISKERLTGEGPFDVKLNKLGVVTGRLRQGLRYEPAVITGNAITAAIGNPVSYASVHEFGFNGTVQIPGHVRRLTDTSLNNKGRLTKKAQASLKAALKQGRKTSAFVKAHVRKVKFPARAPVQTGLAEHMAIIENKIAEEVLKTARGSR